MCRISNAEPNDVDAIFALITQLEEMQFDKKQFTTVYNENLQNPNVFYFVARMNEKAVGFASLHMQKLLHHTANIAEIQELVVTKHYQGNGIGKLLFDEIKKVAISENCLQLEVCCNKKRVDSHTFYELQDMKSNHYKFSLPIKNIIAKNDHTV
ncbi:MAG: family N-acetyltransferase [Anaerosporomusa subterranea]|jgi:PhnO protein|nr:family N-acetyltransferase [Anaerosporomusa subterranea]